MLNLDQTLYSSDAYLQQYNIFTKPIGYSIGAIVLITMIRAQAPEIELLQLIPGFYLIFLFSFFILLLAISEIILKLPQSIDNQKFFGTKTKQKLQTPLVLKTSYLLIFASLLFSITFAIPLSLDCFNLYIEATLINIWSFDEVINLNVILLSLLCCLSQIPQIITLWSTNENILKIIPNLWKIIIIFIAIATGIITPTIDGATQINFSIFSIALYLLIIHIIEKRANVKFIGLNSLIS